jgi:hypothetical protein
MTDKKQYTGRLAPVMRWLDGVTEKHLIRGAGIVLVTGLLSAATAYTNASRIQVPVAGVAGMVQSIATIAAVVMTLLGWVLSSVIYHIGASVFGGKGSLNRMFALSGYASIPLLAQQLLGFIYYVVLGQQASASSSAGILATLVDRFTVFNIIGLILVGVAVMLNYGLSGRKAAIVALLPTILSLAFALLTRQFLGGAAATRAQGSGLFAGLRRSG